MCSMIVRAESSVPLGTIGDHMKRLLCCALVAVLAGCIPIGFQAKSQLVNPPAGDWRTAP